eukprot:195043_1
MAKRQHSLKVIGVGWSKTGTTTLKMVLEDLGFGPCYHGKVIFNINNMKHLDFWEAIEDTADPDWNALFYKYSNDCAPVTYNSIVDWPGAHYWKSLILYYPNAKVILTTRDPNKWFRSARILKPNQWLDIPTNLTKFGDYILAYLLRDDWWIRKNRWQDNTYFKAFGGSQRFCADQESSIRLYNQHIANVKRVVDPKRLFIIDWERNDKQQMYSELLGFLGVATETGNKDGFPHLNENKSAKWTFIKQ